MFYEAKGLYLRFSHILTEKLFPKGNLFIQTMFCLDCKSLDCVFPATILKVTEVFF